MGKSRKKDKSEKIGLLRQKYEAFLEEDRKRRERNEYILRRMDTMRAPAAAVVTAHAPHTLKTKDTINFVISQKHPVQEYAPPFRTYLPASNFLPTQPHHNQMLIPKHVAETESNIEQTIIKEISKKYILIPKLRNQYTYENSEPNPDNQPDAHDPADNEWKSKYDILNKLTSIADDDSKSLTVTKENIPKFDYKTITEDEDCSKEIMTEKSDILIKSSKNIAGSRSDITQNQSINDDIVSRYDPKEITIHDENIANTKNDCSNYSIKKHEKDNSHNYKDIAKNKQINDELLKTPHFISTGKESVYDNNKTLEFSKEEESLKDKEIHFNNQPVDKPSYKETITTENLSREKSLSEQQELKLPPEDSIKNQLQIQSNNMLKTPQLYSQQKYPKSTEEDFAVGEMNEQNPEPSNQEWGEQNIDEISTEKLEPNPYSEGSYDKPEEYGQYGYNQAAPHINDQMLHQNQDYDTSQYVQNEVPNQHALQGQYEDTNQSSVQGHYENPNQGDVLGQYEDPNLSTTLGQCREPDQRTSPGQYGGHDQSIAPGQYGEPDQSIAPGQYVDPYQSTSPGQYGEPDQGIAPDQSIAPGQYGDSDHSIAPGQYGDPDQSTAPGQYQYPNQSAMLGQYEEPNQIVAHEQYEDPNQSTIPEQYEDPNQITTSGPYTDHNQILNQYDDPNQSAAPGQYEDPNQSTTQGQYEDPNQTVAHEQYEEPNQSTVPEQYEDPNQSVLQSQYEVSSVQGQYQDSDQLQYEEHNLNVEQGQYHNPSESGAGGQYENPNENVQGPYQDTNMQGQYDPDPNQYQYETDPNYTDPEYTEYSQQEGVAPSFEEQPGQIEEQHVNEPQPHQYAEQPIVNSPAH